MKRICLYICCFLSIQAQAQVVESFTDGNFTLNPSWRGDTSLFVINASNQLQSNGTTGTSGETAALSTSSSIGGEVVWQFYTRFNLSPSTQNFCRFYLSSDQQDLKASLNGYYVQLGGTTGNTDSISLYRQDGLARARLIGGRPATVAKGVNSCRIKVVKSAQGQWLLYSDTLGGTNYLLEGGATDNTHINSSYTGVYCKYTSTNVKAFYFDEIEIKQGIDSTPPAPDSLRAISLNQLEIVFSEPLSKSSAEDINNYSVNSAIGKPVSATLDALGQRKVILNFVNNFQAGTVYTVNISGVEDLALNTMKSIGKLFSYGSAGSKNLMFNEIMSDPNPPVGLPDFEYIELYNPNNTDVDLSNWTITDGTTTGTFTTGFGKPLIPADSFIILCPLSAVGTFSAYGNTAILSAFPTLNNTGDQLILKDDIGTVRATITYDLGWFGGSSKANGGWSLELVNPFSRCGGTSNWKASVNSLGGTPGTKNSLYNIFTDTVAPSINKAYYTDSQTVVFVFSEPIEVNALQSSRITMNQNLVSATRRITSGGDTLELTLSSPMVDKQNYTFKLDSVKDCELNLKNLEATFTYRLIKKAVFGDIVISEIYAAPLANTPLPNLEWLEIHNNSNNPIFLDGFVLSDGATKGFFQAITIMPDSFMILCGAPNTGKLAGLGTVAGLLSGFPSLNNDGDLLELRDNQGRLIHQVHYDATWYNNSYKKNGGWSLEMIDLTNVCSGKTNWKPSVDSRGGTPGAKNSVNAKNPDLAKPTLIRAYPASTSSVILHFSEPLDTIFTANTGNYSIDNFSAQLINAAVYGGDASRVLLEYNDTFLRNTVYEVQVSDLADCWGNVISSQSVKFGLPGEAAIGDIAINEVLFNPKTGSSDFVELYNLSDKVIDLQTLRLANTDLSGQLKDISLLPPILLLPRSYMAICENELLVKEIYETSNPNGFVDAVSMPSYNDDEGTVVVLTNKNVELERFAYNDKMHHATLSDVEGVSLERVDYTRSVLEITNWQSAASGIGGATPAYQNSQYNGNRVATSSLTLSPSVFSPDGDGYNDILNLNYKMPEAGYQGEFIIYSPEGKLVRHVTKQQLLGIEGSFSWNGIDDEGRKANVGVYIVYFQYFNLKGNVRLEKATVTVAGKL